MSECPTMSAHDYVVTGMYSHQSRCSYHVRCSKCGDFESGYHDEIPPARFATASEVNEVVSNG